MGWCGRYITLHAFATPGPVIVYNYPKDIKAFYMRANDDGKTVAAMDVLVRSDHMWRAWLSVACCLACCHLHVVCCRLSRMHAVICMLSRIHAVYCMSSTAEVGFQVPGVGELIGGSQREERLDVLEAKLDSLGMDKVPPVPSRATAVNLPTVPLTEPIRACWRRSSSHTRLTWYPRGFRLKGIPSAFIPYVALHA